MSKIFLAVKTKASLFVKEVPGKQGYISSIRFSQTRISLSIGRTKGKMGKNEKFGMKEVDGNDKCGDYYLQLHRATTAIVHYSNNLQISSDIWPLVY